MLNTYTNFQVMNMLNPIVEINDEIQEFISTDGELVPTSLIKLISDLDWAVRNVGVMEEALNG